MKCDKGLNVKVFNVLTYFRSKGRAVSFEDIESQIIVDNSPMLTKSRSKSAGSFKMVNMLMERKPL